MLRGDGPWARAGRDAQQRGTLDAPVGSLSFEAKLIDDPLAQQGRSLTVRSLPLDELVPEIGPLEPKRRTGRSERQGSLHRRQHLKRIASLLVDGALGQPLGQSRQLI